jgi:hypothetical protein
VESSTILSPNLYSEIYDVAEKLQGDAYVSRFFLVMVTLLLWKQDTTEKREV